MNQIKEMYDNVASTDKSKKKAVFYDKNELDNEFITETFGCGNPTRYIQNIKPGSIVVDLACGAGADLFLLSKKTENSTLIGIDFSYNMLERAKNNFEKQGIKAFFIQADLKKLPLKNNSVDIIISNAGIHLVYEKKHLFEKLNLILKNHGLMYISDIFSKFEWKNSFFKNEYEKTGGIFLYGGIESEKTYFEKLKNSGFQYRIINSELFSPAAEIIPTLKMKYPKIKEEVIEELKGNIMMAGEYFSYKQPQNIFPALAKCDCGNLIPAFFVSKFAKNSISYKKILKNEINIIKCEKCGEYAEVEDSFMVMINRKKMFIKFPEKWRKFRDMLVEGLGELPEKYEITVFFDPYKFMNRLNSSKSFFERIISVFTRR